MAEIRIPDLGDFEEVEVVDALLDPVRRAVRGPGAPLQRAALASREDVARRPRQRSAGKQQAAV